jgi:Ca2+-dependent lipid-binding protein
VISLTIGSAQLTRNTDWWGVMDPFVRIIHKDVTYTTTLIRNGGKDVSWYEPFEILVDMEDEITFIVLDDDFVSADIVGEVTAVVKDLLARGTDDFVLSLEYRGRSAGTLTASAWKIK